MQTKVVFIVGVLLLVWAINDLTSLTEAGDALFTIARSVVYGIENFVGGGWNV